MVDGTRNWLKLQKDVALCKNSFTHFLAFTDEREKFLYRFVLFCLCMYMREKQTYVRPVSDVELFMC